MTSGPSDRNIVPISRKFTCKHFSTLMFHWVDIMFSWTMSPLHISFCNPAFFIVLPVSFCFLHVSQTPVSYVILLTCTHIWVSTIYHIDIVIFLSSCFPVMFSVSWFSQYFNSVGILMLVVLPLLDFPDSKDWLFVINLWTFKNLADPYFKHGLK